MDDSQRLMLWILSKALRLGRACCVCLTILALSACTQKFKDLGSTVDNAFFGEQDVVLSKQDLESSPYASLYARVDDGRQIHMVLAFAEVDPETGARLLKWMSADRAMLVTLGGRVVKTIALLKTNLAGLSGAPAPSSTALLPFNATYDWQPGYRFGYSAKGSSQRVAEEIVESPLMRFDTQHIKETIYFNELDRSIENHYWLDKNGRVVKTIQYLGPDMHKVELLLIKDFGG